MKDSGIFKPAVSCPFLVIFTGLCCAVQMVHGQDILVTGKVTGQESGYPLYPATITDLRSGTAAYADDSGRYRILTAGGDTLRVSYLGFYSRTFRVPAGLTRVTHDFQLTARTEKLKTLEVQALTPYARDSLDRISTFSDYLSKPEVPGVRMMEHSRDPHSGIPAGLGITLHPFTYFSRDEKRKRRFHRMYSEFERKAFVESRYTPRLVARLTGLSGDSLGMFLARYEPGYDFCRSATDLEFWSWIKIRYASWVARAVPGE